MGYMYPIPAGSPVSQRFGASPGGVNPAGGHTGMDFACPVGTPVYAPADGVIALEGWMKTDDGSDNPWLLTTGGGIVIVLDAGDTKPTFVMAHLNASLVNKDQRVKAGQLIGYTGNTGKWTSGPHLHFEVLLPGYNIRSSTYGRSNPAAVCDHFVARIAPASSTPAPAPAPALKPNQRRAGASPVNQRAEPKLGAKIVRTIPAHSLENFTGYVTNGDEVKVGSQKSRIWYKDNLGYASVLFFDPLTTKGLPDLTPKAPAPAPKPPAPAPAPAPAPKPSPAPVPVPTPPPAPSQEEPYTFAPDSHLVAEVRPAAEGKFLRGNMPAQQTAIVVHQFVAGPDRAKVHLDSVVNSFTGPGDRTASAHFGVEGTRVVQFVSLKDRAYHAGPNGNDFWSIEVYPGMDDVTLATVAALIADLNAKAGRTLTLKRHREIMATQCGDNVDLPKIEALVATAEAEARTPAPSPTPSEDTTKNAAEEKAVIMNFLEFLADLYLSGK